MLSLASTSGISNRVTSGAARSSISPPSFPTQIEALVHELKKPDASNETHIILSLLWAAQFGQPMCLNQLYYTQAVENPAELEPFSTVQPQLEQMSSRRMINMKDAAAEQAAMAMDGIRYSRHLICHLIYKNFPNIEL